MVIVGFHVDGGRDFRSEALDEGARTRAMLGALAAHGSSGEVAVFPAGYYCVRRREEVSRVANRVHSELERLARPTWVIFGVDVMPATGKHADDAAYFFVFASRCAKLLGPLQQASMRSNEKPAAPGGRPFDIQERTLNVGANRVAICICGEAWSATVRSALVNARPDAVLEPAHQAITTGTGRRSWERPLGKIARRTGGPVVLAEHTRRKEKPHVFTKTGAKAGVVGNWIDFAGRISILPVTWTIH